MFSSQCAGQHGNVLADCPAQRSTNGRCCLLESSWARAAHVPLNSVCPCMSASRLHAMSSTSGLPRESSNYRPGEPLRSWTSGEPIAPTDAELIIQASKSLASLRRLINGDHLTDEDLIAFGRLNSNCVLRWYEPIVSLVREPQIDPEVITLLRSSVPGLES